MSSIKQDWSLSKRQNVIGKKLEAELKCKMELKKGVSISEFLLHVRSPNVQMSKNNTTSNYFPKEGKSTLRGFYLAIKKRIIIIIIIIIGHYVTSPFQ